VTSTVAVPRSDRQYSITITSTVRHLIRTRNEGERIAIPYHHSTIMPFVFVVAAAWYIRFLNKTEDHPILLKDGAARAWSKKNIGSAGDEEGNSGNNQQRQQPHDQHYYTSCSKMDDDDDDDDADECDSTALLRKHNGACTSCS
jgi:hypothetical protein